MLSSNLSAKMNQPNSRGVYHVPMSAVIIAMLLVSIDKPVESLVISVLALRFMGQSITSCLCYSD